MVLDSNEKVGEISLEEAKELLNTDYWRIFGELYPGYLENDDYYCFFFEKNGFSMTPRGLFVDKKTGELVINYGWEFLPIMPSMVEGGDWSRSLHWVEA